MAEFLALDVMADVVDDLGVGQCGDIADVGEVRDPGDDPAHDLPGAGLGHVGHDPHVGLVARSFRFPGLDGVVTLSSTALLGAPRLERDIHLDSSAADFVHDGNGRGLGDLLDGEAR